jgi:hypothetical protein
MRCQSSRARSRSGFCSWISSFAAASWCSTDSVSSSLDGLGLLEQIVECGAQVGDGVQELGPDVLQQNRLADLDDDEEQDDRPEPAADAVQEREPDDVGLSASPPSHGQCSDGLRKEPRERMLSAQ